jgi:fructuronate reductase
MTPTTPQTPQTPTTRPLPRLSAAFLADAVPDADPDAPRIPRRRPRQVGIVHLGIGAFHRAHQAVYTEDAADASGDDRWGILGVTQRSARVVDQLRPQDGLYGVLTASPDGDRLRVVGSVVDVAFPGDEADRVVAAIAAPTTHVVTLTITEKGYVPGGAAVELLVRGLEARHRSGGAPLTVLSCDNLVGNGRVLGALVRDAVGADVASWLDASVTFPCSMVDRIVPATDDARRTQAATLLGARDEGLVVAEPFGQWVIEDRFAGPRPAWELAGATLTDDVGPYELAKLRLLNGTHSLLAYAGVLAGHDTIAGAVGDPALAAAATSTLTAPPGVDLAAYADELLERFANPATGHRTGQVAADGTQKIPQRWGPPLAALLDGPGDEVRDATSDGGHVRAYAGALAAWVAFVVRAARGGPGAPPLDDPRADELRAAVKGTAGTVGTAPDPAAVVGPLLALPGLLPPTVASHAGLRAAVAHAVRAFDEHPA